MQARSIPRRRSPRLLHAAIIGSFVLSFYGCETATPLQGGESANAIATDDVPRRSMGRPFGPDDHLEIAELSEGLKSSHPKQFGGVWIESFENDRKLVHIAWSGADPIPGIEDPGLAILVDHVDHSLQALEEVHDAVIADIAPRLGRAFVSAGISIRRNRVVLTIYSEDGRRRWDQVLENVPSGLVEIEYVTTRYRM